MSAFVSALFRYARWRHALGLVVALLLIFSFGLVHGQWSEMHRWNRATADASFVLLTITMGIGPIAQLWPQLRFLVPFRRELGIYAVVLAALHTAIILGGWVTWDLVRLFGFEFHPGLGRYVMVQHGFGLANAVGVLALIYGLTLALTSPIVSSAFWAVLYGNSCNEPRMYSGRSWSFTPDTFCFCSFSTITVRRRRRTRCSLGILY